MSDNNNSAPGFIIYFNSTKIPPERAAEVKKIIIIDRLNAPSTFLIKVADIENEWSENDEYFIGSEVEILMGYQGNFESIMIGDVIGLNCHMKRNQANEVTIKGNNHMHRLKRCITNKAFYDMTVKDIITDIADRAGLKSEVDELAYKHVFTLQNAKTDYEYLFLLADYYDCHFWVDKKTLYFKRLKQNMAEDIILEYGKTLLEFLPESDTSRIVSEVEVKAWNPAKHEAISAMATFSDIDSKGGAVIDDTFGGAEELRLDPQVLDQKTADQRAIDILERNNRNYVTGTGATYGNPEIRAGTIIKAEGLGDKFSGKYFVILAKHILVPLRGYRTSFSFISSLGTPTQAGAGAEAGEKTRVAAGERPGDQEQEDQEKNPEITNLKWMKDGEEVTQANVEDIVVLTAEVKDLDDGTSVRIHIWEKDDVGCDDYIKNFTAYVEKGKIEKLWTVEYHEDTDDVESEQEQKEKGYTLPEYVFKIETINSPDVESGESPLLEVVDWIEVRLKDEITEDPVPNQKFSLMKNGEKVAEGTTDDEGLARIEGIKPGQFQIIIEDDEDTSK